MICCYFHGNQRISVSAVSESTSFGQVLIDTDQRDGVTGWHIFDWLGVFAHHDDGTLHVFDEQIIFLAVHVVRAADADLLTGFDCA